NFDILMFTRKPGWLRKNQPGPNYMGRELFNIAFSDAIGVLGGRFGTGGEYSIALEEGAPVGVLERTGGAARVVRALVRASTSAGKPPQQHVVYDESPEQLTRRLAKVAAKRKASGKPRGAIDGDGSGSK